MTSVETCQQAALAVGSLGDLKTLFDMYHDQMEITDKLWTYFQVITLAIVGFTVGGSKITHSFSDAIIVVAAYLCFCAGNFSALRTAQSTLVSIGNSFTSRACGFDTKLKLHLLAPEDIAKFYWMIALTVSVGILLLTRSRLRQGGTPSVGVE